ncbi:chemotaxis protein CheA [Pseudochryseolinea flava]|uniref:Chemotaxis protein CheA n=1 Tax=Pseudochryseolinea flava TaxID=2059302 RepID=A0A364Y5B8_9BACT|nr:chemotaxis protein CheA [Pseudochryseolinea flava]RAW01017.1 chemotaxis protein CheA [Pseudochryseolinea flava]
MKNKEAEYREIFLAEALENFEAINRLLTQLEKNGQDKNAINALFRITHTLKGNASGMGYSNIAELAHVLEDLFGEMRDGHITVTEEIFSTIFKGVDVLGHLIDAVKEPKEVKFKGIKTKLEVLIKKAKEERENATQTQTENVGVSDLSPFSPDQVNDLAISSSDGAEIPGEADTKLSFSDLVQVPVRKLDNLLNLVGELIIEKDRILASQAGLDMRRSTNEFARLSRISSDLQYSVMDVRLVQVGFLFNKFHRVVRDAASVEKKDVILKLEGTDTEIDRNVLQVISDSLIHLIRNAVGHGIESPADREAAGKPKDGTVWLSAKNDTDAVIIEIRDDGKGLDYDRIKSKAIAKGLLSVEDADKLNEQELSMLIFEPGFSTMDQVTAISGRGVGMDVVKKTLDSIGGTIKVISVKGKGTTLQLTLPSSMAVKSCLLLELQQEVYAIPLSYTESVISLYRSDIHRAGGGLVATHLGKNIAVVFLRDVFAYSNDSLSVTNALQHSFDSIHPETRLEIVVVNFNNRTVGFVVDKLLQQKEIIEKPLMKPVDRIKFISGVTILGTGNVCLVLNIPNLLQFIFNLSSQGRTLKNINLN